MKLPYFSFVDDVALTTTDSQVAVNVDEVVRHHQSQSTAHIFGATGGLPPKTSQAVGRRFVRYWLKRGEEGEEWIGLTKANSARLGTFGEDNLVPGEYKLILSLDKNLSSHPGPIHSFGTMIGGMKALSVSDKEESAYIQARGMPSQYMTVRAVVATENYSLLDARGELDLGMDNEFVRTFTVSKSDAPASLILYCTSYSLVKRLKLRCELLRADLPQPRAGPPPSSTTASPASTVKSITRRLSDQETASLGKRIMSGAFNSSNDDEAQAFAAGAAFGTTSKPPATTATKQKSPPPPKLNRDVDVKAMLEKFYKEHCPGKVDMVDEVLEHFVGRDGHVGVLVQVLEKKYNVQFAPDGTWSSVEPDDDRD